MAKTANKSTSPEASLLNFPVASEKDRIVERHKKEGYDVRCENGIIMFYGDVSYEKVKAMLKADGYNASFGVAKAK